MAPEFTVNVDVTYITHPDRGVPFGTNDLLVVRTRHQSMDVEVIEGCKPLTGVECPGYQAPVVAGAEDRPTLIDP